MKNAFPRSAIVAAIAFIAAPAAFAQAAGQLKEVTVTGNPLGSTDLVAPASSLSGTGLLLRGKSTLGETLDGTPGVSSTYFGPNASRPVIRGLDGDRIRILGNGGATIDASGLSYDHAVPADPISIERIEVLRGPGALMYGGSAVGGVVNVIDNRIPKEATGFNGKLDLGFGTAAREKGAGVMLEGGTDRFALHVDAFDRRTQDVEVPASLACTQNGVTTVRNRICNSAGNVRGGAVGGSLLFDKGYLGASVSTYRNDYGTVAEDEVTIGMKSTRYAVEGEVRGLGGFLQSIKGQASHTDYRHTEFEAGAPGTIFKNQGNDFRLEARHAKWGALEGVIGFQAETTRFSADGDEAFAPYSRTSQRSLFVYEELGQPWGKWTFGGRLESVKVESFGNPLVARFAPASRSFNPGSLAVGFLHNLSPAWQLTSNLAYTQRAPKDYELFADGPHVATGAYEMGNAAMDKERSTNVDVGVKWKGGANTFNVSAFASRFRNYISLDSTGADRDAEGNAGVTDCGDGTSAESGCAAEILPEYAYSQVRARFVGLEAGGNIRLLEGASTIDLELRGDLVRADNLTTGQPLARIAPARAGATLVWGQGPWGARIGFDRAASQSRVPVGQLSTDGYTMWNAALTWKQKAGPANLLWYARVDNAGDKLAYSATSILTQTAPGKSPLPGRNFKVGLQASF